MKRGRTEIYTKKDNYHQGKALIIANEGTGGVGATSIELYKQIWGQVITGDNELNIKALDDVEYMQNIDLTRQYKDRSFEIIGQAQTALMHNEGNSFLITVAAPMFLTDELNFQSRHKEWNQIEYTRLSETGVAEETSFTEWGWTDKLERRKLEAKVSMELALDNNYGASVWQENLAVLASTGLLTLMKEAAYALVTIGYSNHVEEAIGSHAVDLGRLLRYETMAFMACAMGMDRFLSLIRNAQDKVPGYNTVIMPYKTSQRLRDMVGESRQVDATLISLNAQTQEYEQRLGAGPRTVKTAQVGDRSVDFFEMTGFKVNERSDEIEDPMVARVTLCQAIPSNHNIKATDAVALQCANADSLDTFLFYQTTDVGEDRRIAFKEALKHCFAYNKKTGAPSAHLHRLCKVKNDQLDMAVKVPYAFNDLINTGYVASDINDEDQTYDYETPDVQSLQGHTDLEQMVSWRHHCALVTWDPRREEWRVPNRVGDMHLSALPHEWLHRVVRILDGAFAHYSKGQSLRQVIADTNDFFDEIDAAPWTVDYAKAFLDAQMPYILDSDGSVKPVTTDAQGNTIEPSFAVNEFGSNRLPSNESGALDDMVYPPSFYSLETLAREGNKPGSPWQRAGKEAQRLLASLRTTQSFLRETYGDTDVVNGAYAPEALQRDAPLDTLIAAIRGRPGTVYGGVPSTATSQGVAPRAATATPLSDVSTAINAGNAATINLGALTILPSRALRALFSLNAKTFNDYRAEFAAYLDGSLPPNQRDVMERLVEAILATNKFDAARDESKVKFASALTSAVIDALRAGDVKGAGDLITKAAGKRTGEALRAEWANNDYYREDSSDDTLRTRLRTAEENAATSAAVAFVPANQTRTQRRDAVGARAEARPVRFFQGEYDGVNPSQYLRTTLVATQSLDDFIAETGFKWVLPGSASKPAEPATGAELRDRDARIEAGRKRLGGLHALSGVYSALNGMSEKAVVEEMEQEYRFDARLGFGARPVGRGNVVQSAKSDNIADEYFGPWAERLRYANTMENDAERMLFLALIQTPNTLDVHMRLANYGAQIINLIMFRPFIEMTAKSVIVMEARNAILTAMSRAKVIVSKEDRGVFHVGSSFYTGTIRVNPDNIYMIPLCDADRWIGGKNHSFVQSADDWNTPNPQRPSIIVMPTAVCERTYDGQIPADWKSMYLRPDIDVNNHFRKYSSADLFNVVFGERLVGSVKMAHLDRKSYWKFVNVSLAGHLAPRGFIDPRTGDYVQYNGNGPGNDIRQNMPGAEKVFDGQAEFFPNALPIQLNRKLTVG